MTPAALAGPVVELLTPAGGSIAVLGSDAAAWRTALAAAGWRTTEGDPAAAALVSFLGARGDAPRRADTLAAARARLARDGWLVVVDHNRPRRRLARLVAVPGLWVRGLGAARAAYPTAREIAASGFAVERLRLAAGERVQLVLARWRDATSLKTT